MSIPTPSSAVSARGLTKTYGPLTALRDFSLEVSPGEIVALVGPNGAGKTTALTMLVGLLTPTSGEARIAGFDVRRQAVEARQVMAFLPDQPFLYEALTVGEILGFVGGLYRLEASVLRRRAQALLDLFGFAEAIHRRIGELSFGMKSRLVLVASLLHEPRVLIMDEPFFGLDPQTLRLIKQLLQERAKAGMAVVLSTHQLPVVEDLAHRIAVVGHGRLLALGTLDELKRSYGDQRLEELFFRLTGS